MKNAKVTKFSKIKRVTVSKKDNEFKTVMIVKPKKSKTKQLNSNLETTVMNKRALAYFVIIITFIIILIIVTLPGHLKAQTLDLGSSGGIDIAQENANSKLNKEANEKAKGGVKSSIPTSKPVVVLPPPNTSQNQLAIPQNNLQNDQPQYYHNTFPNYNGQPNNLNNNNLNNNNYGQNNQNFNNTNNNNTNNSNTNNNNQNNGSNSEIPSDNDEIQNSLNDIVPLYLANPTDKKGFSVVIPQNTHAKPRINDVVLIRMNITENTIVTFDDTVVNALVSKPTDILDIKNCPSTTNCIMLTAPYSGQTIGVKVFLKSGKIIPLNIVVDDLNSRIRPNQIVRIDTSLVDSAIDENKELNNIKDTDLKSLYEGSKLFDYLYKNNRINTIQDYLKIMNSKTDKEIDDILNRGLINTNYAYYANNPNISKLFISQIRIFDDGVWTYIKMSPNDNLKDRNTNAAKTFIVFEIQSKSLYTPVTYEERLGNYVIIKSVSQIGYFIQFSEAKSDSMCFFYVNPEDNTIQYNFTDLPHTRRFDD